MECHYRYKIKYLYPNEKNIYIISYQQIITLLYIFTIPLSILLNIIEKQDILLFFHLSLHAPISARSTAKGTPINDFWRVETFE